MLGKPLPKLIRFVISNSLLGVAVGWLVACGVLWLNINGIGDLVMNSRSSTVAIFILFISFGFTFAFAVLATAVMLIPVDKDDFDRL